jgi:hypothetical protein
MSHDQLICVHSIDPALIMELTGTAQCQAQLIADMAKIGQWL